MTRAVVFILLALIFSCKTKVKKQEVKAEVFKNYNYQISISIWNRFYGFNNQYVLDNVYDNIGNSSTAMTLQYITCNKQPNEHIENIKQLIFDTTKIEISKQSCDTLFDLTKRFFQTFEFNNYDTVGQSIPIITDDSHASIELNYKGRTLIGVINSVNNPTIGTTQFDSLLNFIEKYKPIKN